MTDFVDNFIDRLEESRKLAGLNDRLFAQKIGINYQTYRNITGKNKRPTNQGPTLETIGNIYSQLGAKEFWRILTGQEPPDSTKLPDPPRIVVNATPRARLVADAIGEGQYLAVPLLKDAVAAGPPAEVRDEAIDGYCLIYASRDWMPHNADAYTCVYVRGRSMWPILDDGDIVAIDHAEKPNSIEDLKHLDGKMCAFKVDGGVTIKWLKYIDKSQTVVGVPQNVDEALDHTVSLQYDEINEGVIGIVRWWWSKR